MKLTSRSFEPNGMIPKKFTCQGQDVNPDLNIANVPKNAKSLVLIVEDPDAPSKTFDHWVTYDIPVDKQSIDTGERPGTQGVNDFGIKGYSGPCPQPTQTNRYFFKLYAIDEYLDLPQGLSKHEVQNAMKGRVLDRTELVGRYAKT